MVHKGEGGVKKDQNLVHVVCECPLKNMYLYKRLHPINPDLPDGENWPKLINDCNKSENV